MEGFWSIENVTDWESLWEEAEPDAVSLMAPSRELPDGRRQVLDPVTTLLLWTLPCIHVDEITNENVEEVFLRTRMLELAQGQMLKRKDKTSDTPEKALFITLPDLQRRIGIKVGAGVRMAPFHKLLLDTLRTRAGEALKEARDED